MSIVQSLVAYSRRLFAIGALGASVGCVTGTIGESPKLHATFTLPDGWTLVDNQPGYVSALLSKATKDGNGPYVKLETIPFGISRGDEQSARSQIRRGYLARQRGETKNDWPEAEFKEIVLPSGSELFAEIGPENYWFSHGDAQHLTWGSVFTFSKDGYVLSFYLSDRVDQYIDEMDLVVRTSMVSFK